MNAYKFYILVLLAFTSSACEKKPTPTAILQTTIDTIDTIETVYYKQDMTRTNPRNSSEIIYRYREMYFHRLVSDSIVGVKGHWYFYNNNKSSVDFEDIYDGNKLIRKNNRDRAAIVYDLIKYPAFKEHHFWSHNTPYSMQYMLRFMLANDAYYQIERLNDTMIQNTDCFQVRIGLAHKSSMPGFASQLEDSEGTVSSTLLCINKQNHYPVRMKYESYSMENPEQMFFTDQTYYDVKFNLNLDEDVQFNTSDDLLHGFEVVERVPDDTR